MNFSRKENGNIFDLFSTLKALNYVEHDVYISELCRMKYELPFREVLVVSK